jgi:hypothetical protein
VGCFFLEKQKVVLFPKYKKNGWEAAASALTFPPKGIISISMETQLR